MLELDRQNALHTFINGIQDWYTSDPNVVPEDPGSNDVERYET